MIEDVEPVFPSSSVALFNTLMSFSRTVESGLLVLKLFNFRIASSKAVVLFLS